jgi:ABC-type glycerol-3-phosphate transport system substrate-binding protein
MIKEQLMRRSIFIILLFSLLLFACRSEDNGPAVSDVETTITLAAPAGFQTVYEQLIEQFQEDQPRIPVQFVPLSGQQAGLSLRERAALADVVLLEGQPPTTDAAAAFLDLTPLMAADPTFDAADFWPGIMDACRAAGLQVGLPFRANASLIFFDKAAFDAAGLPHPEPGWSWEDFRQAVQALTLSDGEQTTRYGFVDSGNPLGLLAPLVDNIIRQSGDTLDGRRIAAELAWYVTLANENVILSESGTLPHERQAAMWVSSQFGLTAARTALGDDLGVVAFPVATGVSQSNPVTAGCALISAGTSHSQAAWTFVHYLSQQALFATGVYPAAPARPSVAQSSGYWEGMGVETAVAIRTALEKGWYRRAEMPELTTVGNALSQALAGETTLAESLPGTVEIQPTPPPPAPEAAIAVPTPRAVPSRNPDAIVIDYDLMAHHHDGDREAVMALARAFNESQDRVWVNATLRQPFAPGAMIDLIDYANGYDCFMSGYYPQSMADRHGDLFFDALYSLTPLFDAEGAAFRDDFLPGYLEYGLVDGELYAWPVNVRPMVIEYNAALLAQQGLDPPTADWTVEDFWELAQAASGRSTYGFALNTIFPDELLLFVPGANYYYDFDTRPMRPNFTDTAVIAALDLLGQMMADGVLYPHTQWPSRRTWTEDAELLSQLPLRINTSQIAMWGNRAGTGASSSAVRTGVAPFPQTTLPIYFGHRGGGDLSLFYISRRSPDPTACWEWLNFLSNQPQAFRGVPIRQSVRESAAWRESVGEEAATAYETMFFWPRDELPDIDRVYEVWAYRTWWADALVSVYEGEDAAAVLRETQRKAELFYDCYTLLTEPDFPQVQACAQQADPDFQR